jgi:PKHD-type hydroxylase
MQFSQQHNDPQNYYWYQQGFTQSELDLIYNELESVPFQAATILGESETPKEIRSSRIKWIPKDSNWNWLYEKLMNMAQMANNELWHFDLTSVDENIQYTEYLAEEEGHYTWHQDIGNGSASLRKISITVQLSSPDEYEGGELQMWKGGDNIVTAERGAGVVFIFPSYMMHRVTTITSGIRRSFVLWVGGQHYK